MSLTTPSTTPSLISQLVLLQSHWLLCCGTLQAKAALATQSRDSLSQLIKVSAQVSLN